MANYKREASKMSVVIIGGHERMENRYKEITAVNLMGEAKKQPKWIKKFVENRD